MTLELECKDETWQFHFPEGETDANMHAWLRKIQLCCKHVPINGVTGEYAVLRVFNVWYLCSGRYIMKFYVSCTSDYSLWNVFIGYIWRIFSFYLR